MVYRADERYGYGTGHSSVDRKRYCSNACKQRAARSRHSITQNYWDAPGYEDRLHMHCEAMAREPWYRRWWHWIVG